MWDLFQTSILMQKTWIRVSKHEYVRAYIGTAYVAQLYEYAYSEYAYTCMKHVYAYTPKTLSQKQQEQK